MAQEYASKQPAGFVNRFEKIAIVGAGGRAGGEIVQQLLKEGKHTITAISRKESTSKVPDGVLQVYAEYTVDSLAEALKGQDVLVITLSVRAPPGTQQLLAEAAKKAGVEWILPNEFGFTGEDEQIAHEVIVGKDKIEARRYMNELGLSWIGLNTGFWYEWSLGMGLPAYGIDIKNRRVRFMDDGEVKLNTSSWPHVGVAGAKLLSLPLYPEDENDIQPTISQWRNKFVHFTSFLVNQKEMLASVQRVTGTTDKDWEFLPSQPAEQIHMQAKEQLKKGNRMAFAEQLYSRFFYPSDQPGNMVMHYGGTDDERLGCVDAEELDEATRRAVRLVEEDYFVKLFGGSARS